MVFVLIKIRTPKDFDLSIYKNFRYMIDFDNEENRSNYNYWDYNYVINLNENTLDIYYDNKKDIYISFPLDDVNTQDMIELEDDINSDECNEYIY